LATKNMTIRRFKLSFLLRLCMDRPEKAQLARLSSSRMPFLTKGSNKYMRPADKELGKHAIIRTGIMLVASRN
jgi:hypothetical protein